jgi:hypothetical protein
MKVSRMMRLLFATAFAVAGLLAQGPGRAIPDLTEQQTAALAKMRDGLAPRMEALSAARIAIIRAAYAEPRDNNALQAKAEAIRIAEADLAGARADAFALLQTSEAKLTPNQIAAVMGGRAVFPDFAPGPRITRGHGTIPNIRQTQVDALTRLSTDLMPLGRTLTKTRAAITLSAYAEPRNDGDIRAKAQAIQAAELALASARADAFAAIQSSSNKLTGDQLNAFIDMGGSFAGIAFTQPEPLNFADREGFVSMFDGHSLKGWDGNPKFWRVEDGAIIGESTLQNPSGNSYIVYRDLEAKDFTLKFEIKVEGSGGSGFQYRSKTGSPWLSNIPDNVTANVGPVNLNWMMTGPQADFWPRSRDYTGQFYSENTPMRILAWRGQVVEGAGMARKQLMGNIGDRQALGTLVKMNDWNEYTVIARGGTLIQIVNGQLMAVMVDDDPASSNNQSGLFGIEIEATTKIYVRNIWVRKIN